MNPPLFGDELLKPVPVIIKEIQRNIEKNFNKDLYKDFNDIFGKSNSQRRNFILFLENLYQMIKNHLPNGYIQHHLLVKKEMEFSALLYQQNIGGRV